MDTITSTMKPTAVLEDKDLYNCHIDNFSKQFPTRTCVSDATSPGKKMSDSISSKSELRRNSILSSQKVHFKEFQMEGINSYGLSNDIYRRSSTIDSKDDNLKSNIQKPVNLHVRTLTFSLLLVY